jgi:ABC-type multidrug transport system permease subunit
MAGAWASFFAVFILVVTYVRPPTDRFLWWSLVPVVVLLTVFYGVLSLKTRQKSAGIVSPAGSRPH